MMQEVKQPQPGRLSRLGNTLDSAILAIAPGWGAKRMAARRRVELSTRIMRRFKGKFRAWEAADNDRFRGGKWLASKLSPDSELEEDLLTLWERARDLYRNDPIAAGAIRGRVDNVVGRGIPVQARVPAIDGVLTDEQANVLNKQLEAVHKQWAKKEQLFAKQRLFERCKAIYGEAFVVISDHGGAATDKPVPLSIQVIDPLRIETPHQFAGDPNVRLGVRFDPANGRALGYYIRTTHPGDNKRVDFSWEYVEADRVCHSFVQEFPDQHRGVPWLAPAMPDLKDAKDFKEAHLIAEQVAACFTAFVKTSDPEGTAERNRTLDDIEELSPASVQYLRPEEEVEFGNPNRPGNSLAPYMEWLYRGVASAIRYPFEMLCKKYENNFSGGRLSLIDGRITFRIWQQEAIEDCWDRVYERFVFECVVTGAVDIDPEAYIEHKAEFHQHYNQLQGWPWVDPVKDVESDTKAIDANLGTEAESLNSRGADWEDTRAQRLRERMQDVEDEAAILERRRSLGLPDYAPDAGSPPADQVEADNARAEKTSDEPVGAAA